MEIIELGPGEFYDRDFLPSGIVLKNSTGIGATEHELYKAKRHSIVISPLKSILKSKEKKSSILSLSGDSFNDSGIEQTIMDYFSNNSIEFKKVHITIESLGKLRQILKRNGIDFINDNFHFTIDEVHMFQTESSYRTFLPTVFDYYKKFEEEKRTCISASLIDFSDPILKSEKITTIVRKGDYTKEFDLHLTNDPIQQLGFLLKKLKGQVHIFVNSVDYAIKAIDLFKLQDAVIFCSEGSRAKAGPYFKEFSSNSVNQFCFYTSSCFTGCDIYSQGTQIVISGESPGRDYRLIRPELIQVMGRMRKDIKKKILIATHKNNNIRKPKNFSLISSAESELVKYSRKLKGKGKFVSALIQRKINSPDSLVRFDLDKKLSINYPFIDNKIARLTDNYDLYNNDKSMLGFLSTLGIVNVHTTTFKFPISLPKAGRKSNTSEFNSAVSKIDVYENDLMARLKDTSSTIFDYRRFEKEIVNKSKGIEKTYLQAYLKHPDFSAFIDCKGDIEELESAGIRKLLHEDFSLTQEVNKVLPISSKHKTGDLAPIVKKLLDHTGVSGIKITNRNVKRYLSLFRKHRDIKFSQKKIRGVQIIA